MKQWIKVGVAAMLLAASSAGADVDEQIQEVAELARGVDSDSRTMMARIPRACRILRQASKEAAAEEAEGETSVAARIDEALEHCKRAVTAVRNGHPQRAGYRVERMVAALGVEEASE